MTMASTTSSRGCCRTAAATVLVLFGLLLLLLQVTWVKAESESASCHDNKPCPEDEYCDQHSYLCAPCSEICDSMVATRTDCNKKCKDYLILQRIATLENNLYLTIIIFAIILLLLAVTVAVIIVRWCRKSGHMPWSFLKRLIGSREKSNPPTMEYTHENPHTKSPKLSTRNSANSNSLPPLPQVSTIGPPSIYNMEGGTASVQTVTTPLSSRYPAEDWRMNHAYDNGGLAITPTENNYEYVEPKLPMRR